MYHLSASMLCADPLAYRETVTELNTLGIDWFHIDVMDGNFVPNFAIGTDTLGALTSIGEFPFYVHMMVSNPAAYVAPFAALGADYYSFHYETTSNPFRLCQMIAAEGMNPAITLNPATPVAVLEDLLPYLSAVTLMAIEPGFSGQSFLPHTYKKIEQLNELRGDLSVLIEVDGGADDEISYRCLEIGADIIVGGYFSLFDKTHAISTNHQRYMKAIKPIKETRV